MEQIFSTINNYDDINKDIQVVIDIVPRIVTSYIEFAKSYDSLRMKLLQSSEDCQRLTTQLTNAHQDISRLENKLHTVRRLFDDEVNKRKLVEEERAFFEGQLDLARDVLKDNRNTLHDETKEKLSFLKEKRSSDLRDKLDTITEIEMETTGSVMSDLSYTRDEDEFLNVSGPETRGRKRQMPSNVQETKRIKSSSTKKIELNGSNTVIATTTVTVGQNGPVSATSVLQAISADDNITTTPNIKRNGPNSGLVPSAPPMCDSDEDVIENGAAGDLGPIATPLNNGNGIQPFSMNTINTRPHIFVQKAMMRGETCNVCSKRMRFSTIGAKCRDCKSVCHAHCKDKVPLPCVPAPNTPNSKNNGHGTIADYTPLSNPMVPSLVIHCIKEVEARGLTEIGIYRIPGSDKEVKGLKEKFLKGKGVPNLSQVPDIHVICGTLKEFLRSLKEPVVTHIRWDEFARAINIKDVNDRKAALTRIINDLPQPNKDTLAYIILHLQRVAESPDCKMPTSNLAKVFGPTLIGYSHNEPENVYAETSVGNQIMSEFLDLSPNFWQSLMCDKENIQNENEMHKTPSSHSLRNFFPTSVKPLKKIKYFETP